MQGPADINNEILDKPAEPQGGMQMSLKSGRRQ